MSKYTEPNLVNQTYKTKPQLLMIFIILHNSDILVFYILIRIYSMQIDADVDAIIQAFGTNFYLILDN